MKEMIPYGKRYKYPHMKPYDVAIWERFMFKFPKAYIYVIYDLPLGTGAEIPADTDENIASDFKTLTQWKVDVVGYRKEFTDVIEIKPNAGLSAIGQVKGYAILYDKSDGKNDKIRPVLITDQLRPDMEKVAAREGVTIIVV